MVFSKVSLQIKFNLWNQLIANNSICQALFRKSTSLLIVNIILYYLWSYVFGHTQNQVQNRKSRPMLWNWLYREIQFVRNCKLRDSCYYNCCRPDPDPCIFFLEVVAPFEIFPVMANTVIISINLCVNCYLKREVSNL